MATGIIQQPSGSEVKTTNSIQIVKLSDGTMIQSTYGLPFTESGTLSAAGSSGIYFGSHTITFPEAFSNNNYMVWGTTKYGTGHSVPFGMNGINSGTSCSIHFYDFYARAMNDGNFVISFTAVGRWK